MTARTIRMISCGPFVRPKQAHVIDALPISVKTLGENTQVGPGAANSIPGQIGRNRPNLCRLNQPWVENLEPS
jgi:hypothetical protein